MKVSEVYCTDFKNDVQRGKKGEDMFAREFLEFLGIKYRNVAHCQQFQAQDIDLDTTIGTYEIKSNYRNNRQIIVEDFTNINPELGKISQGWFYKTNADLLVCVSCNTGVMVLIPMTTEFRCHYEEIKDQYNLIWNKVSRHNGRQWQSAFRYIPLSAIDGYYSFYKKSSGFELT